MTHDFSAAFRSFSYLRWSHRTFLTICVLAAQTFQIPSSAQTGGTLPTGFRDDVVLTGLLEPTAVRFAADGRIFVAEKRGVIKVFDNLADSTPTVFADLNANVYNFWDRGLLGLELDPGFPTNPYIYVLYTYDYNPVTGLRWGTAGVYADPCPTPPGATTDGCVALGRLSKLQAAGNAMTGAEQVLLEGWCQQFPSHSIGALAFGTDGALYVSAGDGASFGFVDYGQAGSPKNPCGDPPSGIGGNQTPPTAEGGALRSQDLRTSGDPVGLNGAVLRLDPATGAPMPDTAINSSDANTRRIIAYGFRNPFRFTIRPGTNEIWVGDVGWGDWEEINRIPVPSDAVVENFGWPCHEGSGRLPAYDDTNLNICENLYTSVNAVTGPYYTYHHNDKVVPSETCPTGSSSISGLAFYGEGTYPPAYTGALFFADYSRNCIWVMFPGSNGLPDPSQRATMVAGAASPVDLQIGPNGDLFYVDFTAGTVHRISYSAANQPPVAVLQANPTSGGAPLTVTFDGSGSSDPDPGDKLTYSWDLNGDGQFGDSTIKCCPTYTYPIGTYRIQLRVTDQAGLFSTASVTISSNNTPPTPSINSPPATLQWKVGDVINFSGSANDQQDGPVPAAQLSWSLVLNHCPSTCHQHPLQAFSGVSTGTFTAPDHQYPSYLELRLTATDSAGLQGATAVQLYPQTTALTFETVPVKLRLSLNATSFKAPFTATVIVGSRNSVSAPSPQFVGNTQYNFVSWSDGQSQSHDIVAGAQSTTYTATYTKVSKR